MLLRGARALLSKRLSSKYVLAIETPEGLKRADFLDFSSNSDLSNRPGIFADVTINGKRCLAGVKSIRKVISKNAIGQIVMPEQLVDIGKGISSGEVKVSSDSKQTTKYPYFELSEEICSLPISQVSDMVFTFDIVDVDGQQRCINIRQSLGEVSAAPLTRTPVIGKRRPTNNRNTRGFARNDKQTNKQNESRKINFKKDFTLS